MGEYNMGEYNMGEYHTGEYHTREYHTGSYNSFGLQFTMIFFIGGSIFYNIYCIFKDKMGNCCFKKKLKQKTLKENLLDECSICLGEMKKKEKVILLDCNHIYHKDCILEWFQKKNNSCPLCREQLL